MIRDDVMDLVIAALLLGLPVVALATATGLGIARMVVRSRRLEMVYRERIARLRAGNWP
jgi:hypothetical protein